jgi:hypothetical protein
MKKEIVLGWVQKLLMMEYNNKWDLVLWILSCVSPALTMNSIACCPCVSSHDPNDYFRKIYYPTGLCNGDTEYSL